MSTKELVWSAAHGQSHSEELRMLIEWYSRLRMYCALRRLTEEWAMYVERWLDVCVWRILVSRSMDAGRRV